jgi:hypothetical protein
MIIIHTFSNASVCVAGVVANVNDDDDDDNVVVVAVVSFVDLATASLLASSSSDVCSGSDSQSAAS